jgi:hypothetical protein
MELGIGRGGDRGLDWGRRGQGRKGICIYGWEVSAFLIYPLERFSLRCVIRRIYCGLWLLHTWVCAIRSFF